MKFSAMFYQMHLGRGQVDVLLIADSLSSNFWYWLCHLLVHF